MKLVVLLTHSFFDAFRAIELGLLLFADVALHLMTTQANSDCAKRRTADETFRLYWICSRLYSKFPYRTFESDYQG